MLPEYLIRIKHVAQWRSNNVEEKANGINPIPVVKNPNVQRNWRRTRSKRNWKEPGLKE